MLDGLLRSVPLVGTRLSLLAFRGEFPTGAISMFYPLHVVVLPVVIIVLLLLVARSAASHGPAQLPGPGRTEGNIVGLPPRVALVKRGGLFLIVGGVLTLVATLVTVNPVWSYGPADPASASAGGGAQWYLAFLDGAQRLVPPGWELVVAGRTVTLAILAPVAVCGLFFLAAMAYPFVECWAAGDSREHHLLTRPRTTPTRTAIGVAGIVFYGVLWAAAGSDVIAHRFSLGIEGTLHALQLALVLGPPAAFLLTKRICFGLQRKDRETVLHGRETGWMSCCPAASTGRSTRPSTSENYGS